jgi:hypothetical protein
MRNLFGYIFVCLLSVILMGCDPSMDLNNRNGCRFIKPISDRSIGPRVDGKIQRRFFSVRDSETSMRAYLPDAQGISINGKPTSIYKVFNKLDDKTYIFGLTTGEAPGWLGTTIPTRDVFLISESGYFPFRDAIIHDDMPVDRIVEMIRLLEAENEKNTRVYFDSRRLYNKTYGDFQSQRDAIAFIAKDFEINPMKTYGKANPMKAESVKLYYPQAGRAKYDDENGISTDELGRTFEAKGVRWSTAYDARNGVHSWIKGILHDPVTHSDMEIHLMALNGYKPGYGETRAVLIGRQVPVSIDGELPGGPVTGRSPEVSGREIADLINASKSIAGPHVGQMIVMDGRGWPDWNFWLPSN